MKTLLYILMLSVPVAVYPQQGFYRSAPMDCAWQNVGNPGFSAGTVTYTSIAVNPVNDQPYVVYADIPAGTATTGPATVMRFDGNNWVNVGEAGFTIIDAGYTTMAFNGAGEPYVAYGATCTTPNKATVMKFFENNWSYVGNGGFSQGQAAYTSLAFSPEGQPYVAFSDLSNSNKTTVMKFDGTGWVNVGIPGFSSGEAWDVNIGFSPSGEPFISYWNYSFGNRATVMKYDGTGWGCVGNSFCTEGRADNPSLAVNPLDGQPYLAYTDSINNYKATVIKFDGTDWMYVGNAGFSTGYASAIKLAFSPSGQPYIFYWDNYLTSSVVRKFDGTDWVNVGSPGFTGGYFSFPAFAFSPSGLPYVAYQDFINSDRATVMKYDFPTGVNDQQESSFTIYPNPATDILNVNLEKIAGKIKVIEVHDLQGKTMSIFEDSHDKVILNTRDYPAGVYILKVRTESSNCIARFCKSNK
jgi:hypothetical protein